MQLFANRKLLLGGILLLLIVGIPLTISLLRQQQETRSRATKSTILAFQPSSTASAPIQKTVGDTVTLDLMVTPGQNQISYLDLEIEYDPTIFATDSASAFVPNFQVLPTILEGPFYTPGKIRAVLAIGSDPTKAIQTVSKAATFTFRTLASTNSIPTTISFGSNTNLLSVAPNDPISENVLSSSTPASILVADTTSPTPIQTTVTPTPPTASVTPTPAPQGMNFSLTLLLHGIGNIGDNPNPTAHSLSNKNPLTPNRPVDIQIYSATNELVLSKSGTVTYNSAGGNFQGTINLGTSIPTGKYTVKVKSDKYLRRFIIGIQSVTTTLDYTLPTTALVAGDSNNDNSLDILDYNFIISCYSDQLPPLSCTVSQKQAADLTDDGNVNQFDYNLFIRELSVQNGD